MLGQGSLADKKPDQGGQIQFHLVILDLKVFQALLLSVSSREEACAEIARQCKAMPSTGVKSTDIHPGGIPKWQKVVKISK